MADIYTVRVLGYLGGANTVSNLVSVSASGPVATTTITGDIRWSVKGTFSSATVTLQVKDPNGVYAVVSGSSITAAKDQIFTFPRYCRNTFRTSSTLSTTDILLSIWSQGANG